MSYLIATGHSVALVSLTPLDPQPASDGVQVVERSFGADRTIHDQGQYIILKYNVLGDMAMYQDVMAQHGLTYVKLAAVTLNAPDDQGYDRRYNGWAQRPLAARDYNKSNFFPRDITIRIVGLVEL